MSRRTFVLKGLFVAKILFTAGVLVAATWRTKPVEPTFQGWVEANFVFVGADEIGRVENAARARRRRHRLRGAAVHGRCRSAKGHRACRTRRTLANAQQTFSRAQELLKTGSGTKKEFDNTRAALSEAEAKLSSSRTQFARRNVFAPAGGSIQQVYFRPGEVVPVGRPVVSLLPPGNVEGALLRSAGAAAADQDRGHHHR